MSGFAESFKELISRQVNGAGSWIVLRHFSTVHSQYWNDRNKEAVGGPAFEYTDNVLLASKQVGINIGRPRDGVGLRIDENSNIEIDLYRYFLPPTVTIKEDDEIFDLDASGTTVPKVDYENKGTGAPILGRYKVRMVIPYRINAGELVYYVAIAKRTHTV